MLKKNYWPGWWLVLALLVSPSAHAALKTLSGHVPAMVAHLSPAGRMAATNRLDLALGLPLRNQAGLNLFLHQLYDPASTNYHRFLTPEQFTGQFGPTEQDYQAVKDFARANGLTVKHVHGNRVLLEINGNVSDIERAFHITMRTYRHPTEARNFFAPDAEPSVEARLPILDISGLSDFAKARPMFHEQPLDAGGQTAFGSAPNGGLIGKDFRNAYAPGTPLNGSGQQVGLFQLTGYDPNDIFAYEAQAGLPNVPLQNVLIDGADGNPDTNGEGEVCLDIEMVIAMATNLDSVVVFEAPNSTFVWNAVLETMVSSNQIKQFSSSWGFSGSPSQTREQIFQQMAAQGQSFFQASGDGDAWTSPIWQPADSTNVTVVGGTTLSMNGFGDSYLSETVWNSGNLGVSWGGNGSGNDYWGSGGGVSVDNAIPYWQTNVNMTTNLGSTTMRNVPDVAMTANQIYATHGSGQISVAAGTSCAAPLWAGFTALMNQQAAGMNLPSVGFLNPAIYALGESTNYAACFHDITVGDNTWPGSTSQFFAVPGYDLCTGWGTPNGTNLINALVGAPPDSLVISPLAGFVANGAVGGPFNATAQVFNLNNTGTGPLNWSLINTSSWFTVLNSGGTLTAGAQTNVTVALAPTVNLLGTGIYPASIFFSNQTTQVAQPRKFTVRIGQSLVTDGGFESGAFTFWTLAGQTEAQMPGGLLIYNAVEPLPHSGNYGAFLGDTTLAFLYQSLLTNPGQGYLLSFWLENPTGGAGQQFEVNWNTNAAATNTIYSITNPGVFAWTNINFVLTATSTNTTLQFGAENMPNFFGLDDISVTTIPTPSFSAVAHQSNGLALTWITLPHVNYLAQYKTNLLQANWLNLGSPMTASSNALTLLDTNSFSVSPQRFYRVTVSP